MDLGLAGVGADLGLSLSEAQQNRLRAYLNLLQHWNSVYNLTAARDPGAMLTQHIADCLAVVRPLLRHAEKGRLLDVGSGGGLPGVVIAAAAPGWDVTCVDSVGKKAAFIAQVAGALRLSNLHSVHSRVESLSGPPFDVITARAFDSLPGLTSSTRRHLAAQGVWMAMKGKRLESELGKVAGDIDVFHVEPLVVPGLRADRCLIWMRVRG